MTIQDFAVFIILFIFADIIFYIVIMKGLLVSSITGPTPADEARARQITPGFAVTLAHTPALAVTMPRVREQGGGRGLAEPLADFDTLVRRELQNLSMPDVRFVPPPYWRAGEGRRLEMTVTQNVVESMTKALNAAAPGNIAALRIAALLHVALCADGCTITPLTPPEQRLGADGALSWAWEVVALKAGEHTLGFDAVLKLRTAGVAEELTYSWHEGRVTAAANRAFALKRFLRRHWKGAATLLTLLAAGAAYAVWR